jgi:hypothetical protein
MPSRLSEAETREVMLKASLKPLDPYPGAHARWRCLCLVCGSEVWPHFSTVRHRGSACDFCARSRRAASNRIPEEEANRIMLSAGVIPLLEYPGALKPWMSECVTCGKICSPSLTNVKRGQGACRHCAGKWDTEAIIAFVNSRGFEPIDDYPGAHKPWRMKCVTCDSEVQPHFSTIKGGGGCQVCAGQVVNHEDAIAVMRKAGLKPLVEYRNAVTPWPSRCLNCNEIVTPTYDSVKRGSGCRVCAVPGFNPSTPALLYLISHEKKAAVKIGITGVEARPNRLREHEKEGWEVFATWEFKVGRQAELVEKAVLEWWRGTLKVPQALTRAEMRQRGETETAWMKDVDPIDTKRFVEEVLSGSEGALEASVRDLGAS